MESVENPGNSTELETREQLLDTKGVDTSLQISTEQRKDSCCFKLKRSCFLCSKPLKTKYNPLPASASLCQKILFGLRCPPHGVLGFYLQFLLLAAVIWTVIVSVTGHAGFPGGHFFSLFVLFFAASAGGYAINFIKLPPLLGMLLVGGLLRNVPVLSIVGENIDVAWSKYLRQIALTIILIRAGLGLDPTALKKLSFAVLRLAFTPCLVECIVDAIVAHFLLDLPWAWSFILGFILAAVSPAVVVPSLLNLSDRGYGLNKGIPTLVIAAASLDDVLAITGHGVALGIAFSKGGVALTLMKGPLEALLGVVYGCVIGVALWYFPTKSGENQSLYRIILLLGFGMVATAGSSAVNLTGAGPLGCLTLAFVAAFRWRKDGTLNSVKSIIGVAWTLFQPFLFGLIGAAVNVTRFDGKLGLGIATLGIGMFARLLTTFGSVHGAGLNMKEKLFVPMAWLPKATVQAAIGGMALDEALGDTYLEELGTTVLTTAVFSIVITAPIGAALIAVFGPRLLVKTDLNKEEDGDDKSLTEP